MTIVAQQLELEYDDSARLECIQALPPRNPDEETVGALVVASEHDNLWHVLITWTADDAAARCQRLGLILQDSWPATRRDANRLRHSLARHSVPAWQRPHPVKGAWFWTRPEVTRVLGLGMFCRFTEPADAA